jgi:uncharacterized protein (UPF0335 family)
MTNPDDIPNRVTRLEHELAEVRQKATDAHILASGADRDGSVMKDVLRAHARSINALRETQVEGFLEMRDGFRKIDDKFKQVDANFRQIDTNFRQIDANFRTVGGEFSKLNTGMAHITALLTNKLNDPED